jgi:hypothetical protein
VRHEAPEGRRVNVVGAWAPYDPGGAHLVFETRRADEGKYDAAAHVQFIIERVAGLPAERPDDYRRARPCVVVLDNYAVHHSKVVKAEVPMLKSAGVSFFFLPPYSPELNMIEPIWRQVKYQDIPDRSFLTIEQLQSAVVTALTARSGSSQSTIQLRQSA